MHRFQLTSDKFSGTAEVWYHDNGLLARIELTTASMDWKQIKYLLQNTAPDISIFEGSLTGSGLTIRKVPFVITVEDFIREYPYKRNTHLVAEYWPRMQPEDQQRAFFAAMEYRDYLQRNQWCKPKIAHTWLKTREYLNDWKKL